MKKTTYGAIVVIILGASVVWGLFHQHAFRKDEQVSAYTAEIDSWHKARITRLEKPYGWLSLVALDWLEEGGNAIPSVGTMTLTKGKVTAQFLPGVQASLHGTKFPGGPVLSDGEKGGPDTIIIGSRAHIILKRGDRFAVRIFDADSPARKHFAGIERYPVSENWKIEARWEAFPLPKPLSIATVIPGYFDEAVATGEAVFTVNGQEYRLMPIAENGGAELFYVFGDKTNGADTYGAGRFLYGEPPKDGKVVIDFNKAYNPPCAFSDFATCPLPLPANRLALRVEAGEKKYGSH
jgi:uncharacterized protein